MPRSLLIGEQYEEIEGNFHLPNIAGENSSTNATIDHTVIN
jgi:hypothetical protein